MASEMTHPHNFSNYDSSAHSSATATARAVVIEGLPDERRTSPIRRSFLLFVLFDFIGMFILWVLYVQLMELPSLTDALKKEIVNYSFTNSMFDMVVLAFWRLVVLELSYGLLKFNKPWSAAIATTGTCAVCLLKIFFYDFQHKTVQVKQSDVFDYVIIISSFVLTWMETWFLDFRVLPKEKAAREVGDIDETAPLLRSSAGNTTMPADFAPSERYFSPIGSSSSDSDSDAPESDHLTISGRSGNGFDITKALQDADTLFIESVRLIDDVMDWNLDSEKPEIGKVFTNRSLRGKNIYKFEGVIDCPPCTVYQDMVENAPQSPSWNLSLHDCRRVQSLDNNTDVLYNIVKEQLGGAVSSRDFVLLRRWGSLPDGRLAVASQSIVHPDCPNVRQHVRGDNGPTIVIIESIMIDNREQTSFRWILDSNIRGWIPQRLVDQAMVGVIYDIMCAMRGHLATITASVSNSTNINVEEDDIDDANLQFLSSRSSPS